MRFKKIKILKYSEKPISHTKAVNTIALKRNLTPKEVDRIVMAFFGKHGIKWFIMKNFPLKIHNFGTFYFHKKTKNAYVKRRKYREKYRRYKMMHGDY